MGGALRGHLVLACLFTMDLFSASLVMHAALMLFDRETQPIDQDWNALNPSASPRMLLMLLHGH